MTRRIARHPAEPKLRRIGIGVIEVDSGNTCGRHWLWATELFYG